MLQRETYEGGYVKVLGSQPTSPISDVTMRTRTSDIFARSPVCMRSVGFQQGRGPRARGQPWPHTQQATEASGRLLLWELTVFYGVLALPFWQETEACHDATRASRELQGFIACRSQRGGRSRCRQRQPTPGRHSSWDSAASQYAEDYHTHRLRALVSPLRPHHPPRPVQTPRPASIGPVAHGRRRRCWKGSASCCRT